MIIFRLQVTHDAGKSAEDPAGRGPDRACSGCPHSSGHHGHQQVAVTVDYFMPLLFCHLMYCHRHCDTQSENNAVTRSNSYYTLSQQSVIFITFIYELTFRWPHQRQPVQMAAFTQTCRTWKNLASRESLWKTRTRKLCLLRDE